MAEKECKKCLETKDLEQFNRDASFRDGRKTKCKTCTRSEYNAEASRKSALKRKFGITPEEYDYLLDAQDGKCWLCKKECGSGRRLAVDHDHTTGEIRGLLCLRCNKYFVGNQNLESVTILKKYFENPPARQMWGGTSKFVPENMINPKKTRRRRRARTIKRQSPRTLRG